MDWILWTMIKIYLFSLKLLLPGILNTVIKTTTTTNQKNLIYRSSTLFLLFFLSLSFFLLPSSFLSKKTGNLTEAQARFSRVVRKKISISWRKIHSSLSKNSGFLWLAMWLLYESLRLILSKVSVYYNMPSWQWIKCDSFSRIIVWSNHFPLIWRKRRNVASTRVPEILQSPCCSGWCDDQSHQESYCTWQTHGRSSEASVWGHRAPTCCPLQSLSILFCFSC